MNILTWTPSESTLIDKAFVQDLVLLQEPCESIIYISAFSCCISSADSTRFCALLMERRSGKVFTTGEGFSNIVGTYIMHRLAICGFKAFNNVHFYDYMVFQEARHGTMRDEAAVMFAISQSGETEPVLNDVRHAKQHGHKIVTFTRRGDSTLAQLSDLVFVIDGAKQTLAGSLPNPFFGYVILTFENLMARYFDQNESV